MVIFALFCRLPTTMLHKKLQYEIEKQRNAATVAALRICLFFSFRHVTFFSADLPHQQDEEVTVWEMLKRAHHTHTYTHKHTPLFWLQLKILSNLKLRRLI
ncbi:hypothetical protein Tsp_02856 [Trichinella spiralis]|uniref:hypothetical protein n=1 Tax=Trichinella spiralis TaxID=6334 RepID=UPI0001EFC985|nr:hypothetical protein Tsp_02856 [Trichinella spiralis]